MVGWTENPIENWKLFNTSGLKVTSDESDNFWKRSPWIQFTNFPISSKSHDAFSRFSGFYIIRLYVIRLFYSIANLWVLAQEVKYIFEYFFNLESFSSETWLIDKVSLFLIY